ncbi:hypothetical protein P9112_007270 [Eukaryota sp. TZLM1-RC]
MPTFLKVVCLLSFITSLSCARVGYFWQVADIHSQWFYRVNSDPSNGGCYLGEGSAGLFGDFQCDTPDLLVESLLNFMKSINPNPDFLLYTGDIMPHKLVLKFIDNDENTVTEANRNLTQLLRSSFPSTQIIPTFGNHDVFPAHQWSKGGSFVYHNTLSFWRDFIPPSQTENFLKGGYFRIDMNQKYSFLVLNSNYWVMYDKSSEGVPDPADQFKWLENELAKLRTEGKKVLISSHVPPGSKGNRPLERDMMNSHHSKLLNILEEYLDILTVYLASHEHSDSFRLFTVDGSTLPVLVAPAVLPEATPIYFGNNPAIRLYEYDTETGQLLDYYQYYLDLEISNARRFPLWQLEYRARSFYSIDDLSGASMRKAVQNLKADEALFEQYYRNINVQVKTPSIDGCVRRVFLCGIEYIDFKEFSNCVYGF